MRNFSLPIAAFVIGISCGLGPANAANAATVDDVGFNLQIAQRASQTAPNGRQSRPRRATKPITGTRRSTNRAVQRAGQRQQQLRRPDATTRNRQARSPTRQSNSQRPNVRRTESRRPRAGQQQRRRPDTRRPQVRPPVSRPGLTGPNTRPPSKGPRIRPDTVHRRPDARGSRQQPQRRPDSRQRARPPRHLDRPTYQRSRAHPNRFSRHPRYGTVIRSLPSRHHRHVHSGITFYYANNAWYRRHHPGFVVVAPPFGLIIPFLPHTYERLVIASDVYFWADGVYYERVSRGYVVVPAPEMRTSGNGVQDLNSSPDMPRLKITARERQTDEQLITDKIECHLWAVDRTGYDPTIVSGGVPQDSYLERKHEYRRQISACLDENGYTVR